ncbi:MAG: T9SS type A sorting domain-containing protein [Crocinitomicaceae bacterium]|nr:T9SS type A sorting domain-containing protein [Flavobacteriales bacterium]NQZ34938.1 T9SS type A sorting domain-containing protein [Crocinitomicaceae bacterium]
MKLLLLAAIVFGTTAIFAQQTNESITIGTENRTYVQYLPTGFDVTTESLPVVFILHGLGDVATNMAGIGTNNIADTARFIAIYPQGTLNSFGSNAWNNGTLLASTSDDIGLMNALMNDMINNYNVDPTRVYVTGFSMGGIMSYHLACALNDRIAAIASMSGTMSTDDIANCVPTYKTPVMHVHGTADGTVPYDSGALPTLSLVPETMDFWIGVHSCSAVTDSTQLPDTASDGITVDRFIWTGCTPNQGLELWRLNGADHVYMSEPSNDFTEANEIWRFFLKWSHPNPSTASTFEIPGQLNVHVFPNPAKESITISSASDIEISIIDINGKVCSITEISSGETTLDVSDLDAGVYLVQGSNGYSERLVIQ